VADTPINQREGRLTVTMPDASPAANDTTELSAFSKGIEGLALESRQNLSIRLAMPLSTIRSGGPLNGMQSDTFVSVVLSNALA
jgi:hypothetical protein